jgi:DNA-binding transcriptional LysR family regulator
MQYMSNIDVRAINLNLLPALEALLVEGSVGGAARRLHVSQSAMSHSLARLRELFGDPLLAPAGRGLAPTPRAVRLLASLPAALERLGAALEAPEPFDPKTSRRVFRLATFDYFELAVLPDLLGYLGRRAPAVGLEIVRFEHSIVPALVSGEIDLALVGGSPSLPLAGLHRATLYREPFAVIARPDHPAIGACLDLETYLSLGHVLVSVEGRRDGVVERELAKVGRSRRVALRVPHFVAAPLAVMASDHVATIALGVAARARELFGLRVHEPPLALPAAAVVALWSKRRDADEGGRWFRELIVSGRALAPPLRALFRRGRRAKGAPSR